jgi:hypothetical protein
MCTYIHFQELRAWNISNLGTSKHLGVCDTSLPAILFVQSLFWHWNAPEAMFANPQGNWVYLHVQYTITYTTCCFRSSQSCIWKGCEYVQRVTAWNVWAKKWLATSHPKKTLSHPPPGQEGVINSTDCQAIYILARGSSVTLIKNRVLVSMPFIQNSFLT